MILHILKIGDWNLDGVPFYAVLALGRQNRKRGSGRAGGHIALNLQYIAFCDGALASRGIHHRPSFATKTCCCLSDSFRAIPLEPGSGGPVAGLSLRILEGELAPDLVSDEIFTYGDIGSPKLIWAAAASAARS